MRLHITIFMKRYRTYNEPFQLRVTCTITIEKKKVLNKQIGGLKRSQVKRNFEISINYIT